MTDSTINRVRELFEGAMELVPEERARFLDQACVDDDPAIRRRVESMLNTETPTRAVPGFGSHDEPDSAFTGMIGQRLGPYEVSRHIGDGGMGTVHEAFRADDVYRKRVAIKLAHHGIDSGLTLARFRRERQILANLQHANIATLVDGGVSADGRPFLVMELVDGTPVTTWCNENTASVDERLRIFEQVCAAVQHAHRNLVVHLDIKPGNILVTDDKTVKLLDFGIAKLLGGGDDDDAMPVTKGGPRAFTREYASPEHIRGDKLTTASDVYSLGVVLFELLAGQRPHSNGPDSTVTSPSSSVTADAAQHCGEKGVEKLRARLRGDLDCIVAMAMRSEPERRYASVDALRSDVARHLAGLPVRAQPDRASYRMSKFVRRNPVGVGLAAATILALVAGVAATTVQAQHAREQQVKAEELNGFLRSILSSVRPATGGRDVPVSEVLDSAANRIARESTIRPLVRAELETVIAQSYQSLGRFDKALLHFHDAQSIRETRGNGDRMLVVSALSNTGGAFLARGDLDSAELMFNKALTLRRSIDSKADTTLASIIGNLGSVAHGRGRPIDSERLHRESINVFRQALGPRDDKVAAEMNNLAVALGEENKWSEAEAMHRSAIAIFKANHAGMNTFVADAENSLATALDIQGKNAAAESTYIEVLNMRRQLLGPTHPDYAWTLFNYSMFLSYTDRCAQAVKYSREVLALRGTVIPDSHASIAASLQTVGRCLDKLGSHAEAESALEESLALRRKYLGDDSWLVGSSEGVLGDHFTLVRDFPRAHQVLMSAQSHLTRAVGAQNPRTLTNAGRLASMYEAWGRPKDAAVWKAKAGAPPAH